MKGRDSSRGSSSAYYSTDLLVCFPSRTPLALAPSPARQSDSKSRRHVSRLGGGGGGGQASPMFWATVPNGKLQMGTAREVAEPTSPKVTCAGQIKVRASKRAAGEGACKNWQSVMEEIERIHNNRSKKRFLGIKRDAMGFLSCLRNIRFDFQCFGSVPRSDVSIDDEEDHVGDDEREEKEDEEESSRTVFSKWFMVLQENRDQNNGDAKNSSFSMKRERKRDSCGFQTMAYNVNPDDAEPAVPPPNALLLMRCRSAPAKSWVETQRAETKQDHGKEQESDRTVKDEEKKTTTKKKDLRSLMEEEKKNSEVMKYDKEFYKLSSDIAKETWVVGGIEDSLSRSRSWKR